MTEEITPEAVINAPTLRDRARAAWAAVIDERASMFRDQAADLVRDALDTDLPPDVAVCPTDEHEARFTLDGIAFIVARSRSDDGDWSLILCAGSGYTNRHAVRCLADVGKWL